MRDNRKIDPSGGTDSAPTQAGSDAAAGPEGAGPNSSGPSGPGPGSADGESPAAVATDRTDGGTDGRTGMSTEGEAPAAGQAERAGSHTGAPASAQSGGPGADGAGPAGAEPSTGDAEPAEAGTATTEAAGRPLGAELDSLRTELDERTLDLQRVTAEYANYRKRVDRDRGLVAEQATGHVLTALLPVLDDLDRAREHGDLVGPFGAVAEQLITATGKFGLTPFGEKGDPFDPTRHEAVAHLTSAEVTEPTCIEVMRRGYLLGDRLLRPAMVAVADPE
ncbi:MAG TPA: nucleotide exchange factor GrpE [Micromonosporaceae bacterium]|nr:nucleotide exchange factor GrpE [Micromonosporaceae bacterium]